MSESSSLRDHFVYRVFDAAGQLLYVGCTKRLDKRWEEHKTSRPQIVAQAATCKLQGPFTYEVARQIERAAIRSGEPLLGWTPTKHRESRARSNWINRRMSALLDAGADLRTAVERAVADADEWFPDPNAHEYAAPAA